MSQIDIDSVLGEQNEFGPRVVVPESYYPVILHVGQTGVSDPKPAEYDDVTGELVKEEGGNVPFVELTADIYEGPFAGVQITRKTYMTPGKSGKGIARWRGACKAITRMSSQTAAVCQRFGITLPTPDGKNTADVQAALGEGFFALDPANRLAFMSAVCNLPAWDGKRVLVKLGLESREGDTPNPVTGKKPIFHNNNFDGFYALDDEKKNLAWYNAVEKPKQIEAKKAMDAIAAGAQA